MCYLTNPLAEVKIEGAWQAAPTGIYKFREASGLGVRWRDSSGAVEVVYLTGKNAYRVPEPSVEVHEQVENLKRIQHLLRVMRHGSLKYRSGPFKGVLHEFRDLFFHRSHRAGD